MDKRPPSFGSTRHIATFVAVAFSLSYAGQALIWATGGIDGPWFATVAPIVMFTPAVAALVALRREHRSLLTLVRGIGSLRHYAIAVIVPAITALAASVVIHRWFGAGPAILEWQGAAVSVPERSVFLLKGHQGLVVFLGNLLVTSAVNAAAGALLAVGEEIGWRAYLQPRLAATVGLIPGLTAVGALWAFWHAPLILQGYTFPAAPVVGAFVLFPVVGVMLSYFLGWLTAGRGSVWPAVLAHGSYNAAFSTMVFRMDFGDQALQAYAVIVAATVLTGLVFLALLWNRIGVRPRQHHSNAKGSEQLF